MHALRGVSFEVPRGELVALKGRSGSGKTTLLNIVGGLDVPDEGCVSVDGLDLSELGEDGLLALRRDRVGFVFQSFGLIPILTAASCPAASSSGSPSHAPSPTAPRSSSPTSRPASWTRRPATP